MGWDLRTRSMPGWRKVTSCGQCSEKGKDCEIRYAYNLGFLAGLAATVGAVVVIGLLAFAARFV